MQREHLCSHVELTTTPDVILVCNVKAGHLNHGAPHGRWTIHVPRHRRHEPSMIGPTLDPVTPRHLSVDPWAGWEEAEAAAYELADYYTRQNQARETAGATR